MSSWGKFTKPIYVYGEKSVKRWDIRTFKVKKSLDNFEKPIEKNK